MSEVDASRTALVVMDVQSIVTPAFGGGPDLVDNINLAISAAREQSLTVIFGRVVFRRGFPEVSPDNQLFSVLKDVMDFTEDNAATGLHPGLQRKAEDPVFVKRRVSSFAGSDLDVLLRGRSIQTVVLAGVSTSGVVLSTVRAAADLDYRIVVLEDCCGDQDPEVHRVLTEKVFPMQATVTTAKDWASSLGVDDGSNA